MITEEIIEQARSRLSTAQLAQLEQRLKGEAPTSRADAITRRPAAEPPEMSFAQQRFWFLERLMPNTPVFNVPAAVRLSGRLDRRPLVRSLAEIVRRHETLRTRFAEEDGRARLWITTAAGEWPLALADLAGLSADRRESEVRKVLAREARRPFDLAREPLLRSVLLRLEPDEHILFINLHHIVSDAFSMGVVYRELALLYRSFAAHRPSPLGALPIAYSDFARWQRRRLDGDDLAPQLAYWRARLAGSPAVLELPTDRPRPAVRALHGTQQRISVPGETVCRLETISRAHDASLFMTLLAAFKVLLARYTGQRDVVVGSVIANRERPEIENLIGFFINTLVLRTDLGGQPTFSQLLARLRGSTLDAYTHQELPFERLVEELSPERHLSHNPLFQVAFQLIQPPPAWQLGDLSMNDVPIHTGAAQFDMTVSLFRGESDLWGWIEYPFDLFDATTVTRWGRHFRGLLADIAEDPRKLLAELSPVSAGERFQILAEWNDTAAASGRGRTLHRMFEEQVERTPEGRAVFFQPPEPGAGRTLTYRELNERANRLAHHLLESGVRRGDGVGVYLERSPEMVIAVLAVHKAAAAYVPLDRRWPAERVRWILESLVIRHLLTDSALLSAVLTFQWQLPCLGDVVCLDVDTPEPPCEPLDAEAVRGMWDLVAERAVDEITAGGFISSYTGEPFSVSEVHEYRDRVVGLAEPWLKPTARVLEIGCGSGWILSAIAPRVAGYVGLDPSELTLAAHRREPDPRWAGRLELVRGFAHEIESLVCGPFDLVLLASTVQFFPGPVYLEKVLRTAHEMLRPGGALIVADVMDVRRKEELRRSLEACRHDGAGTARPARSRADGALYLDEDFFHDFATAHPAVAEVAVHPRREGFDNELRLRYDVVLQKAGGQPSAALTGRRRRKRLSTAGHLAAQPRENPDVAVSSEDLAYVIFTSGSTGMPKGVAVRHQPVINLVEWVNETFAVTARDRLLFTTSLCFDLSVYDIFGILAAGATIHVAGEADLEEPQRLADLLLYQPVTFWDSAPAALEQLMPLLADVERPATSPQAELSRLRLVFLSGDWIPVRMPDQVRASFPDCRVISLGGATEATVWSNFFPIAEVDPRWPSIPYGRPIRNARYYVLDEDLHPLPCPAAGDLYIGGECLALGYAADPGQSAAKFLPDPFCPAAGARLYATGDRARLRADGNIEFLGRLDHQVKIRGFRIELGEIESHLDRHPEVERAVVLVRETAAGRRRLEAWVCPRQVSPGQVSPRQSDEEARERLGGELRHFLGQSLPDYMLPAAYELLPALPMTANGKVDRAELARRAAASSAEDRVELVAPRTTTEKVLAEVWAEVLGLERVGIHDNFFELGGDSILSVQVIAHAKRAGLELSPRDLFQHQTLAELAAVATEAGTPAAQEAPAFAELDLARLRELVPERRIVDAYPLSPHQQLMLAQYLSRDHPGLYLVNGDFLFHGLELEPELFHRAWQQVIDRHPVLHTSFLWEGVDEPLQLVHDRTRVSLETHDWRRFGPAEQQRRILAYFARQAHRGLTLDSAPQTRLGLARLAEQTTLFLWTFNLMLQDGWSFPIILTDVFNCYEALATGREPVFASSLTPYRDYVALTRKLDLAAAEEFWRRTLADFRRPTPLAEHFAGSFEPGKEAEAIKQLVELPSTTKETLQEIAMRHQVTLYTIMAGAWALVLKHYTGHDDVVFGIWVSTRTPELPDADKMVGHFLNILPLRVRLDVERPLLPWLRELQEKLGDQRRFELTPPLLIEKWSEIPAELPLYQSYLVFESFPLGTSLRERRSQWQVNMLNNDVARTGVPLRVEIHPMEEVLGVMMHGFRRYFDDAILGRLIRDFETLVRAVAEDPQQKLAALLALVERRTTDACPSTPKTKSSTIENHRLPALTAMEVAR